MELVWEKIIDTENIIVSPRPVWKCRMCNMYEKRLSCPPFVPSWKEAKEWISYYNRAFAFKFLIDMNRFEKEKREVIKFLLGKEKTLFEKYPFVYTLFPGSCNLCAECPVEKGGKCLKPYLVRPSVDALGIEITSITEIDFSESVLYSLILLE